MTDYQMSFFKPPIATFTDERGTKISASMKPVAVATLKQVYNFITSNEVLEACSAQVRAAPDISLAKKTLLPFVTPCGVFSYRKGDRLLSLSGLLPVDVDKLDSMEEAEEMRDLLFNDPYLDVQLAFVSPSGKGVKAFIPYPTENIKEPLVEVPAFACSAMTYVHLLYDRPGEGTAKGVDTSGKDLARACFLCHDPHARIRNIDKL